MSNQLIKCVHEESFVWSEDHFQNFIQYNFYCPDCRKGWTISCGSIDNPLFISKPFNITHFRQPKTIREPFITRIEGKRIFICHFVGEGADSCPSFYKKMFCSNEDKWRACK